MATVRGVVAGILGKSYKVKLKCTGRAKRFFDLFFVVGRKWITIK